MVNCILCNTYTPKRSGGFWDYDKKIGLFVLCPNCENWLKYQEKQNQREKTMFLQDQVGVKLQDVLDIQTIKEVCPIVPFVLQDKKTISPIICPIVPPSIEGTMDKGPDKDNERTENLSKKSLEVLREELLKNYSKKQTFRVAIGVNGKIGPWETYNQFNPNYNLRELLKDEVVIEFDTPYQNIVVPAICETGINLFNEGISFEVWDHGGKSPHLHIHDLPTKDLTPEELKTFKRVFIRNFVPLEFLPYVDLSLKGIHLIALEWSYHYKGCYGIKVLKSEFKGVKDNDRKI